MMWVKVGSVNFADRVALARLTREDFIDMEGMLGEEAFYSIDRLEPDNLSRILEGFITEKYKIDNFFIIRMWFDPIYNSWNCILCGPELPQVSPGNKLQELTAPRKQEEPSNE